jgi:hypothetical protein
MKMTYLWHQECKWIMQMESHPVSQNMQDVVYEQEQFDVT